MMLLAGFSCFFRSRVNAKEQCSKMLSNFLSKTFFWQFSFGCCWVEAKGQCSKIFSKSPLTFTYIFKLLNRIKFNLLEVNASISRCLVLFFVMLCQVFSAIVLIFCLFLGHVSAGLRSGDWIGPCRTFNNNMTFYSSELTMSPICMKIKCYFNIILTVDCSQEQHRMMKA